ncbi:MAG: hypothetical protein LQ351_002125 [Letrouitia transgressa]|nr:MAG: hypothetical protein LQ351_002125 [Letrouitia transgressa]
MQHFAARGIFRAFPNSKLATPLIDALLLAAAKGSAWRTQLQDAIKNHHSICLGRAVSTESFSARDNKELAINPNGSVLRWADNDELELDSLQDADALAKLLDPYLPQNLRSGIETEKPSSSGSAAGRPVDGLHLLLSRVRKSSAQDQDLLYLLGVAQGRWKAVIWLVRAMLEKRSQSASTTQQSESTASHSLLYPQRLDEATLAPILAQTTPQPTEPLIGDLEKWTDTPGFVVGDEILGQIWRSLGSMILEAADHPIGSIESDLILAHVQHILALFQEFQVLPSALYEYNHTGNSSVIQKPATLSLMSHRLMAAMSDAVLANNYDFSTAEADDLVSQGKEGLFSAEDPEHSIFEQISPRVWPQIWLELVLWSCIEGGWINEAVEIVYEALDHDSTPKWSVIDWNTLDKQVDPELKWLAGSKAELVENPANTLLNHSGPGPYAERPGYLETAPFTISSEVVCALVDALLNTASTDSRVHGNNATYVQNMISGCKRLLDRQGYDLQPSSWNTVIVRMSEALSSDKGPDPIILERILDAWSPDMAESRHAKSSHEINSSAPDYAMSASSAPLGLCYGILESFAHRRDVQGALRVFKKLQKLINAEGSNSESMASNIGPLEGISNAEDGNQKSGLQPPRQIPIDTLASLLDLLVETKNFHSAKDLLFNNQNLIPPQIHLHRAIQPALIRFASATRDTNFLNIVTKALEPPLSGPTLKALLHLQIGSGKWDPVREILGYLRDGKDMGWDAIDMAVLACSVLRQDHAKHNERTTNVDSTTEPRATLLALFNGTYNTPRNPAQPRDYTQMRILYQMSQILSSLPESSFTSLIASFHDQVFKQTYASCKIPTRAFNILLESVVDVYGSLAAKGLWETWCSKNRPFSTSTGQVSEPAVTPDMRTISMVLKPVSESILRRQGSGAEAVDQDKGSGEPGPSEEQKGSAVSKHYYSPREEAELAEWGLARCRELGMKFRTVKQKFRGLLVVKAREGVGSGIGEMQGKNSRSSGSNEHQGRGET